MILAMVCGHTTDGRCRRDVPVLDLVRSRTEQQCYLARHPGNRMDSYHKGIKSTMLGFRSWPHPDGGSG